MRDRILFEYEIAAVTMIRNESRYIGEWLEYHFKLGIDKFYIYNVESSDTVDLLKILDPWIQAGVVEYNDQTKMGDFLQTLNDFVYEHRCDCRYLCMLSVHEFIYVKNGQSLIDFVEEHFAKNIATASLAISRVHFGTSGEEFYHEGSVVDRFIRRSSKDSWINKRITSIMNPRRIRMIDHDAFGKYYGGALAFDENQNLIKWENSNFKSAERIQVNSYFTRSKAEFEKTATEEHPNLFKYRSPDVLDLLEKDAFEDTEFRDYFHEFMKRPFPEVHPRGSKIVFENLVNMLTPASNPNASDRIFEGNAEKFMTCFLLALQNRNIDNRKMRAIELLALESLYHAMTLPELRMWDILWIVNSLPEFLQSQSEQAMRIIRGCKSLMDELILDVAYAGKDWEDHNNLIYYRRLMNVLF